MTKAQKAERAEAMARLREWLAPGDTVWCVLRHVSRSGMLRVIDFKVARKDGEACDFAHIGYNVALALGMRYDRKAEGVRVSGCGMDMGFHVVYNIGRALFPDGFKVEGRGRNGDTSGHDNDGGYALKHRWL